MPKWIDLLSEKHCAGEKGGAAGNNSRAVNSNVLLCVRDHRHTLQLLKAMDTRSPVHEYIRERIKGTRYDSVEKFSSLLQLLWTFSGGTGVPWVVHKLR